MRSTLVALAYFASHAIAGTIVYQVQYNRRDAGTSIQNRIATVADDVALGVVRNIGVWSNHAYTASYDPQGRVVVVARNTAASVGAANSVLSAMAAVVAQNTPGGSSVTNGHEHLGTDSKGSQHGDGVATPTEPSGAQLDYATDDFVHDIGDDEEWDETVLSARDKVKQSQKDDVTGVEGDDALALDWAPRSIQTDESLYAVEGVNPEQGHNKAEEHGHGKGGHETKHEGHKPSTKSPEHGEEPKGGEPSQDPSIEHDDKKGDDEAAQEASEGTPHSPAEHSQHGAHEGHQSGMAKGPSADAKEGSPQHASSGAMHAHHKGKTGEGESSGQASHLGEGSQHASSKPEQMHAHEHHRASPKHGSEESPSEGTDAANHLPSASSKHAQHLWPDTVKEGAGDDANGEQQGPSDALHKSGPEHGHHAAHQEAKHPSGKGAKEQSQPDESSADGQASHEPEHAATHAIHSGRTGNGAEDAMVSGYEAVEWQA